MLQPVRGRIAAVLGDRPAILAIQPRDHPEHQLGRMPQRLIPGKTRRDPINHRRELSPPPIRVYAMGRGDRGQFWSLHKPRTLPRSPPLPVKTRQTTTVTNYGCSSSEASLGPPRWVAGLTWSTAVADMVASGPTLSSGVAAAPRMPGGRGGAAAGACSVSRWSSCRSGS